MQKSRDGKEKYENRGSFQESRCVQMDWEKYRYNLNKMFFRDDDYIKRGSPEYHDFWKFLKKFQAVQQKKCGTTDDPLLSSEHKINFKLNLGEIDDLMNRGYFFKDDCHEEQLTRDQVKEFQQILKLYMDFLQRKRFAMLTKLRQAQVNLPIAQYRKQIIDAIRDNQVVVVAGDTGCGKSTQVPQYLLAEGYESIACTQPRRIACISLCKRVSYETLNEYGSEVAYQIRFEKTKTKHTKILFLTEGLLLRQVASDPMLTNYKVVILDEVHERHLPCDFLLGIVKCLIHQRQDLKVVLMSATINIELFSRFFGDCPVIQVPGRLYPIQVQHMPISIEERSTKSKRVNPAPYVRILQHIDNKYSSTERGDLLIFQSGMTEISTIVEAAKMYAEQTKQWIVLPLHSTLSLSEQDKVFDYAPEGVRKCIVSTNIAETSVTIDGVRFVADSGKVKEMSYDPSCRMQRLQEFWISRASAEQRKGRAGRTGPGLCFRMYSESEYEALVPYSSPEIQRVPLESILLQMISMGLPDGRKFPFLEPPSIIKIEETIESLKEQGALTQEEELTPMGKMLSRLPVDVTIGKMLILGSVFYWLDTMLALAAALSVQSPLTNKSFRDPGAMAARKQLDSQHGDPFTLLNAYHQWLEMKREHSTNTRKWCQRRGLEEQRFYEMTKLRKQFKELLRDAGLVQADEQNAQSSYERAQRHGELKQLRQMKRKYHRTGVRKKKLLRLENEIEGIEEDSDDDDFDIRDVEFRILNDSRQVEEMSSTSQARSYRDIFVLKLLLCSGLYPQIAIADEHNSHKSDADQLYHTKGKPFVVLHPMSTFSFQPDMLRLRDLDIQRLPGFSSRSPLSTKHQLLAYVSLLETTKPYLMNSLRLPAAHTLLLLSPNLDTNQDFARIVADGWLELAFADAAIAQDMVSKSLCIRDLWQMLLERLFQDSQLNGDQETELSPETRKLQKKLTKQLEGFQRIEILHTVRRLLPADIKNLYVGETEGCAIDSVLGVSSTDYKPHPVKGGLQLKPYLTYNCLLDIDQSQLDHILKPWTCPICKTEMQATVLDQVRHQEKCQISSVEKDDDSVNQSSVKGKKEYFCGDCQQQLFLTLTEILKHKHEHNKK